MGKEAQEGVHWKKRVGLFTREYDTELTGVDKAKWCEIAYSLLEPRPAPLGLDRSSRGFKKKIF